MSKYVYIVQSGNAGNDYEATMTIFSTKQKALNYCYTLMHKQEPVSDVIATDCIKDGWVLATYDERLIMWRTNRTLSYVSLMSQVLL
jgi:hypothetical protein